MLVDAGALKDLAASPKTALDDVLVHDPHNDDRIISSRMVGAEKRVTAAKQQGQAMVREEFLSRVIVGLAGVGEGRASGGPRVQHAETEERPVGTMAAHHSPPLGQAGESPYGPISVSKPGVARAAEAKASAAEGTEVKAGGAQMARGAAHSLRTPWSPPAEALLKGGFRDSGG